MIVFNQQEEDTGSIPQLMPVILLFAYFVKRQLNGYVHACRFVTKIIALKLDLLHD